MNYTELYVSTKVTLCRAIAQHMPAEYLGIRCQDPRDTSRVFIGVYKFKGAGYVESQSTNDTHKSESIYELSVDQAYEVLKEVLRAKETKQVSEQSDQAAKQVAMQEAITIEDLDIIHCVQSMH